VLRHWRSSDGSLLNAVELSEIRLGALSCAIATDPSSQREKIVILSGGTLVSIDLKTFSKTYSHSLSIPSSWSKYSSFVCGAGAVVASDRGIRIHSLVGTVLFEIDFPSPRHYLVLPSGNIVTLSSSYDKLQVFSAQSGKSIFSRDFSKSQAVFVDWKVISTSPECTLLCRHDASGALDSCDILCEENGQISLKESPLVSTTLTIWKSVKTNDQFLAVTSEKSISLFSSTPTGFPFSLEVSIPSEYQSRGPFSLANFFALQEKNFIVILEADDGSLLALNSEGHKLWSRDEVLSQLQDAVFLHLAPESSFLEELGDEARVFPPLAARLSAQFSAVLHRFNQLIREGIKVPSVQDISRYIKNPSLVSSRKSELSSRVLVVLTASNSLYGLEADSGKIVWNLKLPGKLFPKLYPIESHTLNKPEVVVFSATHAYIINCRTGTIVTEYKFALRATRILTSGSDDLVFIAMKDAQVSAVLDSRLNTLSLARLALSVFYSEIHRESGVVSGYTLDSEGKSKSIWSLKIDGYLQSLSMSHADKLFSAHREEIDGSFRQMYLNPNLLALASEANSSLYIFLIDIVSGRIVHSVLHKACSGPVKMRLESNLLLYTYWNTKELRHEISSLEMFNSNKNTSEVFSSLLPDSFDVNQMALGLDFQTTSLQLTKTRRGITPKQVLFATTSGHILAVDRRLFDTRRFPEQRDPSARERELGIIPYLTYLPYRYEDTLTYGMRVSWLPCL